MAESLGSRLISADRDEDGASLVEYALLIALIAVAALVAVAFFGVQLGGTYSSVGSSFSGA